HTAGRPNCTLARLGGTFVQRSWGGSGPPRTMAADRQPVGALMTSDTRPPFSPDRIQLDHELTGPSGAPVLLLVAGLGMQRVEWPVAFLDAVHAAGMRTLTVDNRDCGRSTVVGDDSPVEPGFALLRVEPAYTLRDLALDLLEL